ncbi:hydroxymethylglutaryl-CoA synthase [Pseudogracilibacillus auburnensis]|uniref:Hydroxymethylglutaryl-CoA synthase n=1 Tax=Pseudogracilibacillus auburnensis TaxID=1494959 RepID=A0A2V3W826_9BACI|nr:hydroxymethylglutaryl-CoA synthase [Pseudogracilibacillus auburnensis]MBO1001749.1 hydroxymethylglutaryl-CoA synthase [Pseudogracilibacillus auburnensis]PXW89328.1 hydroxymethylglutaryl-CoA synthase [Pseudogracilibacillus auburnensis]
MKIGIDKIGFYTPHLYVDMNELAVARDVEPEKFTIGIGQDEMAIAPITQDPVTLAANAALNILDEEDVSKIDFVMFGTETGIDHSKSAGVYVHHLLGLNPSARTIELKQACYGATAAIQLAKGHIALNPESKVLVLASDIARYGLQTPGEVTQGAGAVALIISADPKIMVLENEQAYVTKDIMDFWRPTYSDIAFVDGKFSNDQYLAFFNTVWAQYKEKANKNIEDFAAICYHLPYTKMGLKALRTILEEGEERTQERLQENFQLSTKYSRKVGNIYTASLYLGLLSLLEMNENLQAGERIGLFSYGSGAVGEFFSGVLQPNYRDYLIVEKHQELFANRKRVTVAEYEEIFTESLPTDGSTVEFETVNDPAAICLTGITEHMRQYLNKSEHSE